MDRKLIAWLLLFMTLMWMYNSMQRNRELAQREQEKQAQTAEEAKKKKLSEVRELAEKAAKEDPNFVPPSEPPRQRISLGSMDSKDNYQLLVTLDSRGASIERMELVSQLEPGRFQYRSLKSKEREGYMGYLAFEPTPSALVVHSVPKGSAAANAKCKENPSLVGLKSDDQIVGWDGISGSPSLYKLEKRLDNRPAGSTIVLSVLRDVPATTPPAEGNQEQTDAQKPQELTFECVLSEKPLDVLRSEDDFMAEQVIGNDPINSCATTLSKIDMSSIDEGENVIPGLEKTLQGNWSAKILDMDEGMGVEFSMPIEGYLRMAGIKANLELVKQYRLFPAKKGADSKDRNSQQHHLELTTIVRNLDDQAHAVSLRQEGLNGVSLEGWWYPTKISPFFFSAAGARDVIVSDGFASHSLFTTRSIVSHASSFPVDPDQPLFGPADNLSKRNVNYIGLDTQAFTAAMLASPSEPNSMSKLNRAKAAVYNSAFKDLNKLPSSKQQAANVGFWFETEANTIAAKGEWKNSYQIFAGPKDPDLLAAYKLDGAIYYGWDIFKFFAKLLRSVLHAFSWLTGNFGIAIVMLTVLVRSCMFPVSRKMALNAQKMQSVQPHLAKLREALKDDPRKMMAGQQMLMKKAGINQFAGCLPALIQLPIVIGLYRCVSVDVGLRQQSLVSGWNWCSNLSGPDMFMDWQSWMPEFIAGRGSGWFGPYLNILPIFTITLFIIQQKVLMPKATDEQTRVAQQMMMVMTIMMGVLFFKVPAGLCIYFITSSSWSLVERFLIKRFTPKASFAELPDNTANEIINTLAKAGSGPIRPQSNSASNDDRPKPKAPKAPETLADLFPGWFGKKEEAKPTQGESGNRPPSKASDRRIKRNKKRNT